MAGNDKTDVLVRGFPKQLLDNFDDTWPKDYQSRSEAVRDLVRKYLRRKGKEV